VVGREARATQGVTDWADSPIDRRTELAVEHRRQASGADLQPGRLRGMLVT
jgi:hypothetical protein